MVLSWFANSPCIVQTCRQQVIPCFGCPELRQVSVRRLFSNDKQGILLQSGPFIDISQIRVFCHRSGHECDERDSEAGVNSNISPPSDMPTPLDSPTETINKGAANLGYGSEDAGVPLCPPEIERVDSTNSLSG